MNNEQLKIFIDEFCSDSLIELDEKIKAMEEEIARLKGAVCAIRTRIQQPRRKQD
jgi:predicted  nucleic acid-binding Zn-ribbon protein